MLISGLLAMVRGFIARFVDRGLGRGGLWSAVCFLESCAGPAKTFSITTRFGRGGVAGTFIATLVVCTIITVRISDMNLDSRIGALDRTLGSCSAWPAAC